MIFAGRADEEMELTVLVAVGVQLLLLINQLRSRPGKTKMFLTVLIVSIGFLASISARL